MNTGRKDRAYPRSNEDTRSYYLFPLGGKGGGVCPNVLGVTSYKYSFDIPKFDVWNRKLILSGDFSAYIDDGPFGFCSHSAGVLQSIWVAISIDGNLTDAEIVAQGVEITEQNYEIEFGEKSIPQPTDTGWDYKIWVHTYWGDASFVSNETPIYDIVKHDYDIKI